MSDERATILCPTTAGVTTQKPSTIVVRQVVAEAEKQKVIDINIEVPPQKPPIEQVMDVYIKDVEIDDITVITDKVIVRGSYEVKVIYVAALPDQPVHAVELRHRKFTQDIAMEGVCKDMEADADVKVEFVDFDFDGDDKCCDGDHHHHHHHNDDDCEDDDHDHHMINRRHVDVSVVFKINAKVFTDREVILSTTTNGQPKG